MILKKVILVLSIALLVMSSISCAKPRQLPHAECEQQYEHIWIHLPNFEGNLNNHEQQYIFARIVKTSGIAYFSIVTQEDVNWINETAGIDTISWYSLNRNATSFAPPQQPSLLNRIFEKLCFSIK